MDRPPLTALGETHRCEPKGDLDRHVLFAAERAADLSIDDPHSIVGHTQDVSDLSAVLGGPLATDLDRHPTLVVEVGGTGLGLEIGVFLMGDLVDTVDDDIGHGPTELNVALPELEMVVRIGAKAIFGVEQRRVGLERFVDVVDDSKWFPLDVERSGPGPRCREGLTDHDCDLVGLPARHGSVDGCTTGVVEADERWLITHGEAVLVDRSIGGGDDVDDARHRTRRIGRHRQHPGVSPAREDDNGVQCSGRNGIACVFDRPVGLGGGVVAERGLTDAHPNTLSSSSTGTTLARRTACMIG